MLMSIMMSCVSVVICGPSPTTRSSNAADDVLNGVYSSTSGAASVGPDTVTDVSASESDESGRGQASAPGSEQPAMPTETSPRTAREAGILRTGTV